MTMRGRRHRRRRRRRERRGRADGVYGGVGGSQLVTGIMRCRIPARAMDLAVVFYVRVVRWDLAAVCVLQVMRSETCAMKAIGAGVLKAASKTRTSEFFGSLLVPAVHHRDQLGKEFVQHLNHLQDLPTGHCDRWRGERIRLPGLGI